MKICRGLRRLRDRRVRDLSDLREASRPQMRADLNWTDEQVDKILDAWDRDSRVKIDAVARECQRRLNREAVALTVVH